MRFKLISFLIIAACCSSSANAVEYIYRDLMANTLPSASCAVEKDAVENASKSYNLNRYSKIFCQSQGYGWHVEVVKIMAKPFVKIAQEVLVARKNAILKTWSSLANVLNRVQWVCGLDKVNLIFNGIVFRLLCQCY